MPAEMHSAADTRERASATTMSSAVPWLVAGWAVLAVLRVQLAGWTTDWQVFWTAGHAVMTGQDPYAAVRALTTDFHYPLFYPGPALLLLAP